jgi:hypothetical protein
VSAVSRRIDRLEPIFDHDQIVANVGLIVPATLMTRLGLEALINERITTGSFRPGRKILTLVAAMIAGATHIDHVNILRSGATQAVLPFRVMAPSTIGTFLRGFTFGHVRQLDVVCSRALARAWNLGAGPGDGRLVVDLDSTICEVHGKQKRAAGYGYTRVLGYHPLLATRAGTGEVLLARMRHGSANTARGVDRFVDELVGVINRAGATGPRFVRADSGFWSWKMIDRLDAHRVGWSITVRMHKSMRQAIASIDDDAWVDIDYTLGGRARAHPVRIFPCERRLARMFGVGPQPWDLGRSHHRKTDGHQPDQADTIDRVGGGDREPIRPASAPASNSVAVG